MSSGPSDQTDACNSEGLDNLSVSTTKPRRRLRRRRETWDVHEYLIKGTDNATKVVSKCEKYSHQSSFRYSSSTTRSHLQHHVLTIDHQETQKRFNSHVILVSNAQHALEKRQHKWKKIKRRWVVSCELPFTTV